MNQLSFDTAPSERIGTSAEGSRSLLSGHIQKVVFFNEVTGQCLLDVKSGDFKNGILVTGFAPWAHAGQSVQAVLREPVNENFDSPYVAECLEIGDPRNERFLRKFLRSDAMMDLGKVLAKSLAEAFPENLLTILNLDPQRLTQVHGVGKKRIEQVLEAWHRFNALNEFRKFLFAEGMPLEWAQMLWGSYQEKGLEIFKENPYETARDFDFSFDIIDKYALKAGFPFQSEERARCALRDILQTHYKQGHCAYPEKLLLDEAAKKLEVYPEVLENALEIELVENSMVEESIHQTPCIYLYEVWYLEKEVSKKLLAFKDKEPPWGWFNLEKVLHWAQSLLNIQLAPLQKEAIEMALSASLTVITGGPGTGKTTLVRSLTAILQTQFLKFALCSPTGRAAKRLEEATGHPAQTIHRLLKMNALTGEFTYNRQNPLDVDLVLIDEVSMVDLALMYHLLEALPEHCALILVGDADQIPPVGAGNILQSMIDSNQFTVVRLKEIFRQTEESLIKINAHRINSGEMPLKTAQDKTDFHYIPVHGSEQAKAMVFDLATRVIPQEYGITDLKQVQILAPLNTGNLGTQKLNLELQRCFADNTKSSSRIIGLEQNFTPGDKVMVIKNDYKKNLYNGDIGFIRRIDSQMQILDIEFDDRVIRFDFEELDRITLAYAISIHKSQGSEYKAVIVLVTEEHLPMAQRHLIYTAVTRGKEQVFLVAEPQALQRALSSDENNKRWQKLTELLKNSIERV
jgi:exodeoxyribonuclease V alpha subunit